jgi:hypothetical protein
MLIVTVAVNGYFIPQHDMLLFLPCTIKLLQSLRPKIFHGTLVAEKQGGKTLAQSI